MGKIELKKRLSNTFFKTYLLILIPISISLILCLYITFAYNRQYTFLLKDTYSHKLESIFNENETSIQAIINSVRALENNGTFMAVANDQGSSATASEISDSIYTIRQILESNSLIQSIAIVSRSGNTVYSTGGNTTIEDYFYNEAKYDSYNIDFWRAYQQPLSEYLILSPTIMHTYNLQNSVMPVVFTQIGNTKITKLLIINISIPQIMENAQKQTITDNSLFLLLNKQNGQIFDAKTPTFSSSVSADMLDKITNDTYSTFDYRSNNNKRNLIISYSASRSLLGYSFAVMIPYSDIHKQMLPIQKILAVVIMLAIVLTLVLAYMSTRKIYAPIKSIASLFGGHTTEKNDSGDITEYIYSSVLEILNSNKNLIQEYSNTLPAAQEHYLINLLNSTEYYPELRNIKLDFKYDYFSSTVLKITPTDLFYKKFTNIEYISIQLGLHNILQSAFDEKYDTYVIPSESDTLYVLLNLPDSNQEKEISKIIDEFRQNLSADHEFIELNITRGGIYPGLEGLKKSHYEAVTAMSMHMEAPEHSLIKIHALGDRDEAENYSFSLNDENTLLNYILSGNLELTRELTKKIIYENITKNIREKTLIHLYFHILSTIFKAMRIKKINYDPDMNGDFEIINNILSLPMNEIYNTIFKLIDEIEEFMLKSNQTLDIQTVIDYIEKNYKKDLSRESISEELGINENKLSKVIKDELGMNFVSYLASVRIKKAKELLEKSDKNVTEIYEATGFNNRNTFIRTFKKEVGITPSEYRKKYKK